MGKPKKKNIKGKKTKIKTVADLELDALRDRRKKISDDCSLRRNTLERDFESFYQRNPGYAPKPKSKPTQSPRAAVPCSDARFASCEAVVYDYTSGNRKIVQWDKMPPKEKKNKGKSAGVSDCGCYF